jgi:hypothetical protein
MVMHIIGVRFQELVQEHVERETISLSEKQVVAFQIGLVIHAIIHNAFSPQFFQ